MVGFGSEKIKSALVAALGLVLAIFLGYTLGSGGYEPIVLGFLIVSGLAFWFGSGRFLWVLAIASSFLSGTFPILGGSFNTFQILTMMGVAKFILEDVVMRRTFKPEIARIDILLIAGFMGVLIVHGLHDRFGMRFLGSSVWGGRNYVNVFIGLAAFIIVQSIPMKMKIWNKLPYLVLGVISFDLAVAIFTTVFPGSIYFIYPFYSAVANASVQEAITGAVEITGRIGAFGNFGFILILIVLASVSLRRLFHPSKLFRLAAAGLGGVAVLYSGFRTAVLNAVIGIILAGIRDLKFGVLLLLPMLGVFLLGISMVNEITPLPKQIQRGLAFLPGTWDKEMALDAAASDDFRWRVWTLWTQQFFPRHPVIGRGFGFKSEWVQRDTDLGRATDYQQMVETGNIHNGFLATLDAVGILGTVFFIGWNIRLLVLCLGVGFEKDDETAFVRRFLALYLGVTLLFYWIGATAIGTSLPGEFALAGVLLRLQSSRNPVAKTDRSAAPMFEELPTQSRMIV
ncbi:MAG: hypothetical protein H0T83_07880 [Chthoniobacterales bacterium]|nr:hypothetical protein [Chthoniobacterales bacterium]